MSSRPSASALVVLLMLAFACASACSDDGNSDAQLPDTTSPVLTPDGGGAAPNVLDAASPSASVPGPSRPGPSATPDAATPPGPGTPVSDAGTASDAGKPALLPDSGADAGTPSASCLDGITDFVKAGPFKYTTKTAGKVKFWVPTVPAGCKVPVVHLANGTTASCSNYQNALQHLATHGFLAACYEDPDTGAGSQGLMAFETALSMFPELADSKLGSTGHSQGGQAAFTVLQLAEQKWGDKMIYAGLAMQPASGFGEQPTGGTWQQVYAKIKSPMFMFSGTADVLVSESWVQQAFDALADTTEAYWWSAVGATHIPTPEEPEKQVSIPWFRWKLLGDLKACEFFKKMPDGDQWDKRKAQNEKPCQ